MGVIQFIERDMYHQIFLRQSHILIHLAQRKSAFETITNSNNWPREIRKNLPLRKDYQGIDWCELCYSRQTGLVTSYMPPLSMMACLPSFVTSWQSIKRTSGTDLIVMPSAHKSQRPPGMLRRYAVYKHICLRGDDSRIDEPKEKETANKRTDSIISSLGVFPL